MPSFFSETQYYNSCGNCCSDHPDQGQYLRAAKAREMRPTEIEILTYYSAKYNPVSFTRQNVYNFCMKLDGIDREKMKVAAENVLDENWLPSHSEQYRNAYLPAYRVVYKDYKKLYSLKDLEEEEESEKTTSDSQED